MIKKVLFPLRAGRSSSLLVDRKGTLIKMHLLFVESEVTIDISNEGGHLAFLPKGKSSPLWGGGFVFPFI